ncbi:Uncharacterised protein [Mycobacterium tuberculosis]|nr:Uncharacterised protein [Mycobacterium tuberculosis]
MRPLAQSPAGRSTGESLNEHRGARPAGKAGGVSSAYAATADQKQRRDNVFLHLVRGRVDTVGLAALGGDCPGLVCRHPIGLVDPLAARRAARAIRRWGVSRPVRHAGAGRGGRRAGRAAGLDDRGLPSGIRDWSNVAGDYLHRRRACRRALYRGGVIRLQPVDRHPRISAERLCRGVGVGPADVAGGGSGRRGDAQVGAR